MKYLLPALICLFISSPLILSAQSSDHVPGEIILMLKPGASLSDLLSKPVQTTPVVRLQLAKTLSRSLRIHLISFEAELINEADVLRHIRKQESVELAQYNHYLEIRGKTATTPNDPSFASQWALDNTGQNGGTPDADIDAPEAWDLARGEGLSSLGDTMVIAIVDGGADLAHEDLLFWKNRAEIPGNNLDDDLNGYIDDYDGWNAFDSNGSISTDLHGTEVCGIAGALGDNATGISGLVWQTQLMPIEASTSVESIVVEGYGYAYEMRKRYNESGGTAGAFIVVANSSFGFNFGTPANFPLWCAMYDSLGQIGILSVGATTNSSVDVDAQGDIPTTCPSDFLISVTNTTRNDQKLPAAGFGITHIDLGAPGTDILGTTPNNNYGTDTGTSFAAPHVSSTIALMLEAACPEFLALYKNDPAGMSLVLRDLLLEGVDTLSSLQGLTATSGRLNAFKSVQNMIAYCATLPSCVPPFDITAISQTDSSAVLNWSATDSADSFVLEYRLEGGSVWIPDTLTGLNTSLSGLTGCTEYEVRLASICGDSLSDFSPIILFTSEGCCVPPDQIVADSIGNEVIRLVWEPVFAAQSYNLRFRQAGTTPWTTLNTTDSVLTVPGLNPCTAYEFQLATQCDTGLSVYSPTLTLTTQGCGACLDLAYCESEGEDSVGEWIKSISIGPIFNDSGNDNGYGNFTNTSPSFETGISYPVELVPAFSGFPFNEYWRIWVDLNQDGDFEDSGEMVFDAGIASNDTVAGQITIPTNAIGGSTRMRVSMKFFSSTGGTPPTSCESFDFGEVEDYCISIQVDSSVCLPPDNFEADSIGLGYASVSWEASFQADSYLVRLWSPGGAFQDTIVAGTGLTFDNLALCLEYAAQIAALCDTSFSSFSDSLLFTTLGCDACQDLPYCPSAGDNVLDEWIASVRIDTFSNISGSDAGYGDFLDLSLQLRRGETYDLQLIPGFSGQPFGEYWQVRVDFNRDGDFEDAGELVYDAGMPMSDTINTQLAIPANAQAGATRLRVSMRFDTAPPACGSVDFGEVEDYCLEILNGTLLPTLPSKRIRVYPNPATTQLIVEAETIIKSVQLLDLAGRKLSVPIQKEATRSILKVNDLPAGLYILQVRTGAGMQAIRVRVE